MSWLGRELIARENSLPQNLLGALLLLLLVPAIVLVAIFALLLRPFTRPAERSAAEVARYLRDFRDGTGGEWDFDDFIGERIADPRLESIRKRAAGLENICDPEALTALIAEAEALGAHDEPAASRLDSVTERS
ncbi:hypothetical protein [Sphingomonas sp. KR3-1]|uniref:hypothetical protein n=1 Tax=Sphingomonas sp. KR3-1 TaxID=3156611 RepID=UPI0032B50D65